MVRLDSSSGPVQQSAAPWALFWPMATANRNFPLRVLSPAMRPVGRAPLRPVAMVRLGSCSGVAAVDEVLRLPDEVPHLEVPVCCLSMGGLYLGEEWLSTTQLIRCFMSRGIFEPWLFHCRCVPGRRSLCVAEFGGGKPWCYVVAVGPHGERVYNLCVLWLIMQRQRGRPSSACLCRSCMLPPMRYSWRLLRSGRGIWSGPYQPCTASHDQWRWSRAERFRGGQSVEEWRPFPGAVRSGLGDANSTQLAGIGGDGAGAGTK